MKITPIDDQLLVKLDEPEKNRKGIDVRLPGPLVPKRGTVVAAGPGKRTDAGGLLPMRVKVKDRVILKQHWCGDDIAYNGKPHTMVRECDIYGTFEDE